MPFPNGVPEQILGPKMEPSTKRREEGLTDMLVKLITQLFRHVQVMEDGDDKNGVDLKLISVRR